MHRSPPPVVSPGSPWLPHRRSRPGAAWRLFCLPHAGAGASTFRAWEELLAPEIELCALQLPGREGRFGEPLATAVEPLAERLAAAIAPHLDLPFAFFGHSLGALLAYATALELGRRRAPSPRWFFASACRAPHCAPRRTPIHHLPSEGFRRELARLGGTPPEILAHDEMMGLLEPALRADLGMAYEYRPAPQPLACPMTVFGAVDDPEVELAELEEWRASSCAPVQLRRLPGGHFFLARQRPALVGEIRRTLLAPG